MNRSLFFALAIALAVCVSGPPTLAQDATAEPRLTTPPWTLEAVKAFWKKGLIVRTVETIDGGKEPRRVEISVTAADEQGLTLDVRATDAAGHPTSTALVRPWAAVYDALRIPLENLTVSSEKIQTPAGRFECVVYRREQRIDGAMGGARTAVWLSKDRPGLLVKQERFEGGGEATEVLESIVLPR